MNTLPDKSGSMRYRPELLTSDNEQLQLLIGNCYSDILKLDYIIEQYAYALEVIQPSAPGKIAIRYLKRRWGGVSGRHPQVLQWYKSRNGRFLYNRFKTNEILVKVKTYPVFAPVEQDVKLILREAIASITHREALLTAINNSKRQLASMFARSEKHRDEKLAQIQEWIPKLVERREHLIKDWHEAVEAADESMPADAVAHPSTRPRVDLTGKTRGEVHSTTRRK